MSRIIGTIAIIGFASCAPQRVWEDSDDWFDNGQDYSVTESVSFTEVTYGFPELDEDGIAAINELFDYGDFASWVQTEFAMEDIEGAKLDPGLACEWNGNASLPREIEGIVTITPDFYFKSSGCDSNSDEKYYGSYFIEDRTGGIMVLGDSKVGHFDVGNKIRMKVRGARYAFGQTMVYAHDIVSVDYAVHDLHYTVADQLLGDKDIGVVTRATGTVKSEPDTFGQIFIELDGDDTCNKRQGEIVPDGCVGVTLDSELTRRGFSVSVGDRIQATGPVLFSYDIYNIVVMRVGQIEFLED